MGRDQSPPRRASDADRDTVVEALRAAAVDGRLPLDELEARAATAYEARTFDELDALVADLGVELPPPPSVPLHRPGAGDPAGSHVEPPSEGHSARPATSGELTIGRKGLLRLRGRWKVPDRVVVHRMRRGGLIDLTEAEILVPEVEFALDIAYGFLRIVVPDGTPVRSDEVSLASSTVVVQSPGWLARRRLRRASAREDPPDVR